jgi:DNA ligase-1
MTFAQLAKYFKTLEETPSRNTMTEILAEVFKGASKDEIREICYLMQGRVVPLYEAIEFGIADKLMIRAIAKAYDKHDEDVVKEFKKAGDLGVAAELLHHGKGEFTVSDVFSKLDVLARAGGEGSQDIKIGLLSDLLSHVDSLSARYIARIPLDKLRLGFSDMTMLDALSWMIKGDKSLRDELERAYNVRPDIGFIATALKEHGVLGLRHVKAHVGAPILAALCQRIPTADEMVKKMCRRPTESRGRASSTEASGGMIAVEPKYDGVRVQIHYEKAEGKGQKAKVKTFSRNLENTTEMFPELQEIGKELDGEEVILDSEAVGIDPATNKLIPFQETMTRKRKYDIKEAQISVPLKFFVFDILYKNGTDLLSTPLSKRREILEKTLRPFGETQGKQAQGKHLMLSPQIITDNADILREYHDEQLKKGLEGAVVKKWESPYEPGRRNYSWVKFKEEEGKTGKLTDTIDAVIMGYSRGEGKRSGFGIGMFLVGVRKNDTFVTLSKIGTGVSDNLWKELHRELHGIKVSSKPNEYVNVDKLFTPDVWVAPSVVVEIAGDDLTRSSNHGAGVAVRFPRLVRIRRDKSPKEATTVKELISMFNAQKQSSV